MFQKLTGEEKRMGKGYGVRWEQEGHAGTATKA